MGQAIELKNAVIGVIPTFSDAETTVSQLLHEGFARDDISVLLPGTDLAHRARMQHTDATPVGAAAGAGTGGVLGGTLGILIGMGALVLPGLGPVLALGPLLAALTGAAAGAAAGGVGGALVGYGISEIEATYYEDKLRDGYVLIAVHVTNERDGARAKRALSRFVAKAPSEPKVLSHGGASTAF